MVRPTSWFLASGTGWMIGVDYELNLEMTLRYRSRDIEEIVEYKQMTGLKILYWEQRYKVQ